MRKKQTEKEKYYGFRANKEFALAIDNRLQELNKDFSKYVRELILSEILMKSQNGTSLKSILNS